MRTKCLVIPALCLVAACSGNEADARSSRDPASSVDGTGEGGVQAAGGDSEGTSAGQGTADDNCEEHVVSADRATPDMLVVLDRSGSMNPDTNDDGADRWGGSREAVVQVTGEYDDRVRFGLMTFPAFEASGGGGRGGNGAGQCAAGTVNVPIELGQGDAIASVLAGMDASGRTPTAPTLEGALAVIGSLQTAPDMVVTPKYILLVTDGDPNCSGSGGQPGEPDPVARTQTIDAITALTAQGVQTFVVGYQTAGTDFAAQLDLMAAAGGTGATSHQSVDSGADLATTFSKIASGVVSCSYKLDAPVDDASYVLVTVAGTKRTLNDAADGWTLGSDKQTVTVTGAACEAVKSGAVFAVEVKCSVVNTVI